MQSTNAFVETGKSAEIPGQVVSEKFGHILSSGLPSLYRGAYRLLGNAADAEDAVQDALLAAYTHLDQFKGQSKMSTWLVSIVQNAARMQLRRRPRHVYVPLDEPIGQVEQPSVLRRLADRRPSPEDDYRNTELSRRLAHFQSQLTRLCAKRFSFVTSMACRSAKRHEFWTYRLEQ